LKLFDRGQIATNPPLLRYLSNDFVLRAERHGYSILARRGDASKANQQNGDQAAVPPTASRPASTPPFAAIADILAALKAKELVQIYLEGIEAYARKRPALNSIILVNPNALITADALDAKFAQSGLTGPLHCVPVIVKDNFDTTDMPRIRRDHCR
jgi:hypothetical protein